MVKVKSDMEVQISSSDQDTNYFELSKNKTLYVYVLFAAFLLLVSLVLFLAWVDLWVCEAIKILSLLVLSIH